MQESVRGFFRRQTQKVGQTYGHNEKTVDPALVEMVCRYECMRKANEFLTKAVDGFCKNIAATTESLNEVRAAMVLVQSVEKDVFVNEARQLEVAYDELLGQQEAIIKSLRGSSVEPLLRVKEKDQEVKATLDELEAKALEFDFFRNKVKELKATPQKDPTRLPRNEQELENWDRYYHAQSTKTKEDVTSVLDEGRKAQYQTISSFFVAYTAYLSGAVSVCRFVFRENAAAADTAAEVSSMPITLSPPYESQPQPSPQAPQERDPFTMTMTL